MAGELTRERNRLPPPDYVFIPPYLLANVGRSFREECLNINSHMPVDLRILAIKQDVVLASKHPSGIWKRPEDPVAAVACSAIPAAATNSVLLGSTSRQSGASDQGKYLSKV